jgi:hypothetical protein
MWQCLIATLINPFVVLFHDSASPVTKHQPLFAQRTEWPFPAGKTRVSSLNSRRNRDAADWKAQKAMKNEI